jgi:hypothetical protein
MGQYFIPVNLDKKEYIDPHTLGTGLKLWEQLANWPGTGAALVVLCAAERGARGGGDFDMEDNWHGPERQFPRDNMQPGPMPETYQTIAQRTIGRWAGDRIAIVGDYAVDSDLAAEHKAASIYNRCMSDEEAVSALEKLTTKVAGVTTKEEAEEIQAEVRDIITNRFRDITADVCAVIGHEMRGEFTGGSWRQFKQKT